LAVLRLQAKRPVFSRREAAHLLPLILLAAAAGAVACGLNAPEKDDSFYAPPAVQNLAHPDRPMGFDVEWIVPFSSGVKLRTDIGLMTNVLEVFWAGVSRLTGIEYLALYHVLGTFLFGAAFVLAYFWLISRFSNSASALLVGALAVTVAAFLLFRENDLGFGILMNKIWIGKTVLMTVMIPVTAGRILSMYSSR